MAQPQIIFLPVPEHLFQQYSKHGFSMHPDIPVPVELHHNDGEKPSLEGLTIEMIISGMLKVIAEGSTGWTDYYRQCVLALRPGIMDELTDAAIIKAQAGDLQLAREILHILLGVFPSSPDAMLDRILAAAEHAAGEETGLDFLRSFIESYPLEWKGWFALGWALRRLGRWEKAAAAFGKAIELGAYSTEARNELAICLMELGDLAGARRELEAALHQDNKNIKIISNLGILSQKSGKTAEAAAFFRTHRREPVAAEEDYSGYIRECLNIV